MQTLKSLRSQCEASADALTIFRSRNVSGGNLIMLPIIAGALGLSFFISLYVQNVLHYSPLPIRLSCVVL